MDRSAPQPFSSLELPDVLDDGTGGGSVEERLDALAAGLSAAVPSFWGLEVVVTRAGHPVVLTVRRAAGTEPGGTLALTSLRVPLRLLAAGSEEGGHLVVHASVPGALVDLAADAAYVLGPDGIVLDDDLPPEGRAPGVLGLVELAAVQRAYGALIEQGRAPEEVEELLRRRAAAAGLEPYALALEVLGSTPPEPPAPTG